MGYFFLNIIKEKNRNLLIAYVNTNTRSSHTQRRGVGDGGLTTVFMDVRKYVPESHEIA